MRSKIFYLLFSLLFISSIITAQNDDDWWEDDWHDNWSVNVFNSDSRPFIELNYGFSKFAHRAIGTNIFNDLGLAEIKLGYATQDNLDNKYLTEFEDTYFFISNSSKEVKFGNSAALIKPELWRFGFAKRDGYGYRSEILGFMPYHQGGVSWSRLNISSPDIRTFAPIETPFLDRFNNEFRFGTSNEAGVKLEFAEGFFSIDASYETSVIFPRYLIWKHLGSFIIESAAQKAVDSFVEEIMDASPAAGPIVNFLLKNGLSYAFFALKKDGMNWPFKTENPLTMEAFKVGLSFNF